MSLLQKAAVDPSANIEGEKDTLGGGGTKESGVYPAKVKLAYVTEASSGAIGVNFEFDLGSGSTFKITEYITSGKAKGGKSTYTNKDGKEQFLPGYNTVTSIAQLTVGKEITDLTEETKVVKLYDYESKKEIPQEVSVLTELIGQSLALGIIKQVVNKNVKVDGVYVPTNETREENILDKVFSINGLTRAEIAAGATEPKFLEQWKAKNLGVTRNRVKPGIDAPKQAGGATSAAPTKSLFT